MLKNLSDDIAYGIGQSMSIENKQFDPITISLMVLGIIINIYKLCVDLNHKSIQKPNFLQRWWLRRVINVKIPKHNKQYNTYIYNALLNKGSIISKEEYDQYIDELSNMDIGKALHETGLG
jgi:hypothetical protein